MLVLRGGRERERERERELEREEIKGRSGGERCVEEAVSGSERKQKLS